MRSTLDADSPYADAAVHGDGLTSLQFRRTQGRGARSRSTSAVTGADVVQLERKGNTYTMSVARFGEPFTVSTVSDLALGDEVYAGLFLCSHNPDVVETAVFRDVRVIRPAKDGFVPYRDYIGSAPRDPGRGHAATARSCTRSAEPFEAPNWTKDGSALIYNTSGRGEGRGPPLPLRPCDAAAGASSTPASRIRNNNDHVLSFDGDHARHQRPEPGRRPVDDLHRARGGRDAEADHARWRRRTSTAGRRTGSILVYTGGRDNEYDIYRIPVRRQRSRGER